MNYDEIINENYAYFNDYNAMINGATAYNEFVYQGFSYSNTAGSILTPSTSTAYTETVSDGYLYNNTPNALLSIFNSSNYAYSSTAKVSVLKKESIQENYNYTTDLNVGKVITLSIEDTFNYSSQVNTNAEYLQKISENYSVKTILNTYKEVNGNLELDDTLDCWVVNYETNSFSRYSNYSFDSFTKIGNTYYGVNELGLFKIGGTTDNGKEIKGKVLTGQIDVSGLGSQSYVRDIILYQKSDGTMRLNVYGNDNKVETYRIFNPSDDSVASRIVLSKGRKTIYWQFELTNDEQTDFEIEQVKIYRVVTSQIT